VNGRPLSFSWAKTGDECPFSHEAKLTTHLPPGVASFTLEVRDEAGHVSQDDLLVEITAAPGAK
jgi:hypothetical protein